MRRTAPAWSIFRRTPADIDYERLGTVHAHTQGEALNHARRAFGGSPEPVVAHAPTGAGMPADVALDRDTAPRRSRRWAA